MWWLARWTSHRNFVRKIVVSGCLGLGICNHIVLFTWTSGYCTLSLSRCTNGHLEKLLVESLGWTRHPIQGGGGWGRVGRVPLTLTLPSCFHFFLIHAICTPKYGEELNVNRINSSHCVYQLFSNLYHIFLRLNGKNSFTGCFVLNLRDATCTCIFKEKRLDFCKALSSRIQL